MQKQEANEDEPRKLKIDGLFELHGKFYKQVASDMTRHKMLLEQVA
jgi:hypothetical protein